MREASGIRHQASGFGNCGRCLAATRRGARPLRTPYRQLSIIAILLFFAASVNPLFAQTPDIAALEQRLRDNPSQTVRVELAEAYLHDCQLDKSLAMWRQVLAAEPEHKRAQLVVARLTAAGVDLDTHLSIIESLIDKDIRSGLEELLDKAAERAASDEHKARVLYLRGRRHLPADAGRAPARAELLSAMKLYPNTASAGRAAIALAELDEAELDLGRAERTLAAVIENPKQSAEIRELAGLHRVLIAGFGFSSAERIAAIREFLKAVKSDSVRLKALQAVVDASRGGHDSWTVEAVAALGQMMRVGPRGDELLEVLGQLFEAASSSQRADVLAELWAIAEGEPPGQDGEIRTRWAVFAVETLLSQAVVDDEPAAMSARLARAGAILDEMARGASHTARLDIAHLRGRVLLIEAQKLAALGQPETALPRLLRARDHFITMLGKAGAEDGPASSARDENFAQIVNIGRLLEQLKEYETAVVLYRQVATRFPHLASGRDALLRVAQLLDSRLDSPVEALEVYAEYSARYPAELPYRQLAVGQRLRRLGYANLLDFQKRNNLKTDGLFGPASREKLAELEASFSLIALDSSGFDAASDNRTTAPAPKAASRPPHSTEEILRGQFVHPQMFAIASKLEQAGRHREAIHAYRLFLNLFPTKAQADSALLSIARLFRDNLLFAEALGAYHQLMSDWPKGEHTSLAYIEAAACMENLSRWKDARELYDLYVRKFPKYPHVKLCRQRIELLDQVNQFAEFIAANPNSPRLAEAKYQLATILYKGFGNLTKAAVEFRAVADRFPGHPRAADGLFTAGTCQLRAENFPAARRHFADLVARYPESRLADDAQYWIGHTFEYAARALGRLDDARIVLRRRTLAGQAGLIADVELRRFYADMGPEGAGDRPVVEIPPDRMANWGGDALGVLTSGSKRDRVNAYLREAIAAYRKAVDDFKMGDMAGNALLRIGTIYTEYLNDADKGAEAYRELLANYPGSKEAVDALFEVGNYQAGQSRFEEAIKSYQQFIYKYPNEPKVEDAMLAVARCHAESKTWDKALDAFQAYLNKYPSGRFAAQARGQIEWIRMYVIP